MTPDFVESVTVEPELVHLGEPVTIRITSELEYVPLSLEVTARYLEQEFTVGDGVRVTWDDSGPVKHGQAVFVPDAPGNYLVRFGELHRPFGVADDKSYLCTVTLPYASSGHARGNQLDFYHPDVHTRHIPVDYAVHITDALSLDSGWDVHKTLRGFRIVYGDGVIPSLGMMSAGAFNISNVGDIAALSVDEAGEVIRSLKTSWESLGYGSLAIIDLAMPDQNLVEAAVQQGVYGVGGAGARNPTNDPALWTQILPLHFDIPNAIGFHEPFVHLSETRNTLNPAVYARQGQTSTEVYREIDKLIDRNSGLSLISVVLDGDTYDVVEMNRETLAYLVEKPRTTNLVFCRKQAIASYAMGRN